jgi:hypothetical protein
MGDFSRPTPVSDATNGRRPERAIVVSAPCYLVCPGARAGAAGAIGETDCRTG